MTAGIAGFVIGLIVGGPLGYATAAIVFVSRDMRGDDGE